MTTVQEALDFLQEECRTIKKGESKKYVNTLQKLIDKTKPKKIIHEIVQSKINKRYYHEFWFCPNCKKIVTKDDEFCVNCGQALDWRVEE